MTASLGLLWGCGLGAALVLLVAAVRGWKPVLGRGRRRRGGLLWGTGARQRLLYAVLVALVVVVLTRWPVAGLAGGALIWLWPTMFGGAREGAAQIERLEALATWTESLRDTTAGAIGLEQAIPNSLTAAPMVLQEPLTRLTGRLESSIPIHVALAQFGDELNDQSADRVLGALLLNAQLRGPGLVATLSALADSTREELDLRRRVEEGRNSLRRSALIIVIFTGVIAAAVSLFSRAYVEPYATPGGQVMLVVVLAVFGAGLMWMRSAAVMKPPPRFLVTADDIDVTTTVGSRS